jgi:hypothetical protein
MKSKQNWLSMIGLGTLALAVMGLLVFTLLEAWVYHYLGGLITFWVLLGAGFAIYFEAKRIGKAPAEKDKINLFSSQGLAVLAGALAAFALAHELGLGSVIAASLVGLIAYIFLPKLNAAAYCGAFVGMTSNMLLFNWLEVGLAGLIAAILFVLTIDVFSGFGGKLGTIAFTGTVLACTCLRREFILSPIADWQTNAAIILVSMLATPLTFYINTRTQLGPVFASAFVGLASGLVLPIALPQSGLILSVVAICASFAGMTSKTRCPNSWQILVAGFFTGVVFVYSTPLLGGAGGKLGTIAFGAVLATCGLKRLLGWISGLQRPENQDQGA